jgi:hypothetical protein
VTTETFMIESWFEFLHVRERVTNADKIVEERIHQLLTEAPHATILSPPSALTELGEGVRPTQVSIAGINGACPSAPRSASNFPVSSSLWHMILRLTRAGKPPSPSQPLVWNGLSNHTFY